MTLAEWDTLWLVCVGGVGENRVYILGVCGVGLGVGLKSVCGLGFELISGKWVINN